jgi:predicted nicotinamide N-methyase
VTIKIQLGDLIGSQGPWDVVLAGDVAYQRDMADPIMTWLEGLAKTGTLVLIGDPQRAYLPREKLRSLASYEVPVSLALEDATVKRTDVWSFL